MTRNDRARIKSKKKQNAIQTVIEKAPTTNGTQKFNLFVFLITVLTVILFGQIHLY